MNNPWIELVPEIEIDRFKALKDVKVVFDVGTRTSLEYLAVNPKAIYHLFEPYQPFYEWLKQETKEMKNVFVNGYGLGDKNEKRGYSVSLQSFMGQGVDILPIKTLDWYIKKNKIKRIDFLKIDTEGWDYKVLLGGKKAIKMARYIQYETFREQENKIMVDLLKNNFIMENIGFRNMFCTRK